MRGYFVELGISAFHQVVFIASLPEQDLDVTEPPITVARLETTKGATRQVQRENDNRPRTVDDRK